MENRELVSRWCHTEIPTFSLLVAPTTSKRVGTSLLVPFMAFSFLLSFLWEKLTSPQWFLRASIPPPPRSASPHLHHKTATHTHSRAGTKALKAALYVPPQLPSQPLLQRSPGKDAYSSAPKGPHCCQLVTGRHRDSKLTALAKQEKWAQWGVRGPALFLHPPPPPFSPQEIPFSTRLFKTPPPAPILPSVHARRDMHVQGCAALGDAKLRDAKHAVKGTPGRAGVPRYRVINISACFFLPLLHPRLWFQIPPPPTHTCLSARQDKRDILFLPAFPTQAGFLEGGGMGQG